MCSRRGAVMIFVPLEDVTVTKGEDKLTLYQFNTKSAKHYFCSICGIYTHHATRSHPDKFNVNVGCLEGKYFVHTSRHYPITFDEDQ